MRGCAFSISSNSTTEKRLFAHRVGQLAAGVEADVARRRAEQAGAGVLFGEFAHVETQVGALVAEYQLRERLRQFGLAHAGRPREEQHAARPAAARARLRAGQPHHRALQDVERLDHRRVLALDAIFDERLRVADLFAQVVLAPRVVERAHLVAAHRVVDGHDPQALPAGELGDVGQRRERHALGAFGEGFQKLLLRRVAGFAVAAEEGRQLPRRALARLIVGAADDQACHALAVEREPRGQILRPVDQPQHRIEQRQPACLLRRYGRGVQRQLFGGDKKTVLALGQVIGLPRQARGKVEHQRAADVALRRQLFHQVGKRLQAYHLAAAGQFQVEQPLGQFARFVLIRIDAQAVGRVEHQQARIPARLEGLPDRAQQRRQRGPAGERHQKAVADAARNDKLRAYRQQAFEVGQPAWRRHTHLSSRASGLAAGDGASSSAKRGNLLRSTSCTGTSPASSRRVTFMCTPRISSAFSNAGNSAHQRSSAM